MPPPYKTVIHTWSGRKACVCSQPGKCLTCWPGSCLPRRHSFPLSSKCEMAVSSVSCGAQVLLSGASWGSSVWVSTGSSDSPELQLLLPNEFPAVLHSGEWPATLNTHTHLFSLKIYLLDDFRIKEYILVVTSETTLKNVNKSKDNSFSLSRFTMPIFMSYLYNYIV